MRQILTRKGVLVSLILGAVTLSVFAQVSNYKFVSLDDDLYVYANPHVKNGLSWNSFKWAFTTQCSAPWHPLTWLSHMLDWQLFGPYPGGHHLTNVLFHVANSLLLFATLRYLTGTFWRSALVAGLFALHPLHVESVAWVAERKDVLSTFFLTLTLLAYGWYARRPGLRRYLLVLALFTLGLMAKPMIVTLPFLLLLLDFWPLERIGVSFPLCHDDLRKWPGLLLEKTPMVAISAAICVLTVQIAKASNALAPLQRLTLTVRLENAFVSYIRYIAQMLWPTRLAAYYPHPQGTLPAWQVVGSVLLFISATALALALARKRPYVTVGWLWYVIALLPVIQIVQAGPHAYADRYTYIPLNGLFIIIAWGVTDLSEKWLHKEMMRASAAAAWLYFLCSVTWVQLQYWHDNISLYRRAIAVASNNGAAHNNLGVELAAQGNLEEAFDHFVAAVRFDPYYDLAHCNLGQALFLRGDTERAIAQYQAALQITPGRPEAVCGLADILCERGTPEQAEPYLREAIRLHPDSAAPRYHLGEVLLLQGRTQEAAASFEEVLRIEPDNSAARQYLDKTKLRVPASGDAKPVQP